MLAASVLACETPHRQPVAETLATRPDTVVRRVVRVPRRPAAMQRVTGVVDARRALVPLDSPLAIRVLDGRGAALPGVRAQWSLGAAGEGARLQVLGEVTDSLGESRAVFTPGRTANEQRVAAAVPGVGRIDFAFLVPVARVEIEPDRGTLWTGDALVAGVSLQDVAGTPLTGGAVSWAVSDSTVLRATPVDSTHARVTGGLAGSADLVGWIGLASGRSRFVVHPVTTGTFETLDGGPVPPLHLEVRSGEWRDTPVVADAAFTTRVPPRASTEVDFHATPSDPGRYHPVHVRVLSPRDLHVVNVALIPTTWRIEAGTYRGREVPIQAAAALRRVGGRAPFWRIAPVSGRGPKTLLGWRSADLPVRIAFNRPASGGRIDAADSAAFWAVARRMEEDLGARFFEPATLDGAERGVVPVEIREQMAEGHTFVAWSQAGDAHDAVLLFRSSTALRDPHVATHELLHLLGFGHATAWPTVARPVGGREPRLTPEDVAHVHVALRLREQQARTGARPGLPAASQ